jgi:PPOX class probable FMN-dependent enzyme
MTPVPHRITTLDDLTALYGEVNTNSLRKELPRLSPEYGRLLAASPFMAVATAGPGGLDCSPRGDPAGSVAILDESTIAFADRRGNNRLDTLKNLIADPRIALLFLIPGVNETLRINGRAEVTTDPVLVGRFLLQGKAPVCVVVVAIEAVYFQCARALIRSDLWNPDRHVDRKTLPSAGDMTRAADPTFEAAPYDAALADRQRRTLY